MSEQKRNRKIVHSITLEMDSDGFLSMDSKGIPNEVVFFGLLEAAKCRAGIAFGGQEPKKEETPFMAFGNDDNGEPPPEIKALMEALEQNGAKCGVVSIDLSNLFGIAGNKTTAN